MLPVCGDQGSSLWVHRVFFDGETAEERRCGGLALSAWWAEPSPSPLSGSETFKVVAVFCKELRGDEALLTVRRYEMT